MKNETVFVEVFGNSENLLELGDAILGVLENQTQKKKGSRHNPIIKVLDFLITFQAFDYPLTEIAKNSGVSYSTLQTFWEKLEKNNIVIKTRRVGKSDLFKLNTNNPAVKQLIKLDWNLIKGAEQEVVV